MPAPIPTAVNSSSPWRPRRGSTSVTPSSAKSWMARKSPSRSRNHRATPTTGPACPWFFKECASSAFNAHAEPGQPVPPAERADFRAAWRAADLGGRDRTLFLQPARPGVDRARGVSGLLGAARLVALRPEELAQGSGCARELARAGWGDDAGHCVAALPLERAAFGRRGRYPGRAGTGQRGAGRAPADTIPISAGTLMDPNDKKKALRLLTYGLYVATSRDRSEEHDRKSTRLNSS